MKANFGKDNDEKNRNKSEMFSGGYERMLKERKKKMPDLEAAVNEVLDDWSGETLCIIKIHEDENGDASGQHVFMGGVSKLGNQIALAQVLDKTADEVRDKLLNVAKQDPSAAKQILGDMLESILGDLKKKIKE